ncbi:MAG: hypothetical protein ACJ788_00600 [Ktedonobacteraceae bacterium]
MKGRTSSILWTIVAFLAIVGGITGFLLWYVGILQPQRAKIPIAINQYGIPVATVYPQDAPPTPGSARTTYTNTKYGYSFIYPSEWKLRMVTNQNNVVIVQGLYQVQAGVDGYPFEVGCQANPQGLDAQSWFNQHGGGTGIGDITLKSGVTAFLAIEHGQVGVKDYILVHNHIVCSFDVVIANDANNGITEAIVNSFKWQ